MNGDATEEELGRRLGRRAAAWDAASSRGTPPGTQPGTQLGPQPGDAARDRQGRSQGRRRTQGPPPGTQPGPPGPARYAAGDAPPPQPGRSQGRRRGTAAWDAAGAAAWDQPGRSQGRSLGRTRIEIQRTDKRNRGGGMSTSKELTVQQRAAVALESSKAAAEGACRVVKRITEIKPCRQGRVPLSSNGETKARTAIKSVLKAARRRDPVQQGIIAEEARPSPSSSRKESRLKVLRDEWDAKEAREKAAKPKRNGCACWNERINALFKQSGAAPISMLPKAGKSSPNQAIEIDSVRRVFRRGQRRRATPSRVQSDRRGQAGRPRGPRRHHPR